MRRRIYVETTIISNLTARPSTNIIGAAHQQITKDWWETKRLHYDIFVSELVLKEAAAGDPEAARMRLAVAADIPRLMLSEDALALAGEFLERRLLPTKAAEDSLHIALAIVHSMDALLTWNCAHLANPWIQVGLARFLRSLDLELPIICTPEELSGEEP